MGLARSEPMITAEGCFVTFSVAASSREAGNRFVAASQALREAGVSDAATVRVLCAAQPDDAGLDDASAKKLAAMSLSALARAFENESDLSKRKALATAIRQKLSGDPDVAKSLTGVL